MRKHISYIYHIYYIIPTLWGLKLTSYCCSSLCKTTLHDTCASHCHRLPLVTLSIRFRFQFSKYWTHPSICYSRCVFSCGISFLHISWCKL